MGNARGCGIGRGGIARFAQQLGGKVLAGRSGFIARLGVNESRAREGDKCGKKIGKGFTGHGRSSLESWRRWRRASSAPGPLPEAKVSRTSPTLMFPAMRSCGGNSLVQSNPSQGLNSVLSMQKLGATSMLKGRKRRSTIKQDERR